MTCLRIGCAAVLVAVSAAPWPAADADARETKPRGPSAVCVSNDQKTAYVVCEDAACLLFVDLDAGMVSARIPLPRRPTGLTLDRSAGQLYVTCAAATSRIVVVDTARRERVRSFPAGHTAVAPQLSPDGRRLYVCNRFDHCVSVMDPATGSELAQVPVAREPIASALTPDGTRLVVANHLPRGPADGLLVQAEVDIIETADFRTTTVRLCDGSSGLRGLAISPDGRHAAVTHIVSNFDLPASHLDEGWMNNNSVSVIDLAAGRLVGNALLDDRYAGAANPWAAAFSPDGNRLFVTLAGLSELSVSPLVPLLEYAAEGVDDRGPMGSDHRLSPLRRRIALPGVGPRAMAVLRDRVLVTEYFSDTLAIVNLDAEPAEIRRIALGPPPRLSTARRGEIWFHDARICFEGWQSCSSCHPEGRADAINWDLVNDGLGNAKNTKSLLAAHQTPPAMARGVRDSAATAVRSGLKHILFAEPEEEIAGAMDAYLRSLEPVTSPHRDGNSLTPAAERGRRLFHSDVAGCVRCHPPPLYTDLRLHSIGERDVDGRNTYDTPTLIEVWRTGPYLHNGRYGTLRDLLIDGRHGFPAEPVRELTDREIEDLVQFVLSL